MMRLITKTKLYFQKFIPKWVIKTLYVFITFYTIFLLLNWFFPIKPLPEYSTQIESTNNQLLHAYLTNNDKWRMYTTMDEITPDLKKAILFKEDKYFRYHPGINPVAIVRAAFNNLKSGKRTSGASTITMQVARLLEPKERSYKNKMVEMFRALQLEHKYRKDEILQLYLNLVPYGSNIEGIKAASVLYLGKMPNHLSIAEIATLSIIPNRPVSLRLGKNNQTIVEERNKWLSRYGRSNVFDEESILEAINEPLNAYRREAPKLAPHLSYRIKNNAGSNGIVKTTIHKETQQSCANIVKNYIKTTYFRNIKNACVLVVDNETRSAIAYIGSADFNNNEDGGQVDGTVAIRSPGSTLKPLLYALAIDEGLATPKTVILDVPTSFLGYEPENYTGKFIGNIAMENALALSLNVPAVRLLEKVQVHNFVKLLDRMNFVAISQNRKNLGLSVVLGGCGATLEELTTMYCAFANEGQYGSLQYLKENAPFQLKTMVTDGAAFMVTDILTRLQRPDLPVNWAETRDTPKIAWKTGTSYGRKDAWSIGYNKKYTVGVWCGNFSGVGVPELTGADIATPLLFKIFNHIDYQPKSGWFDKPDTVDMRYVCSETGLEPNHFCANQTIDYYIPGVSPTDECRHLKKIWINADSTISYCSRCVPKLGYAEALYPNLPPELITYYNTYQIKYLQVPPHNPKCEALKKGTAPIITSPIANNQYFVNIDDSMQIKLSCHTPDDVETVYWYINQQYFKSCPAHQSIFFVPNEGIVNISCSDDKGRNSNIEIEVKYSSF